jgi:hypothetical protein
MILAPGGIMGIEVALADMVVTKGCFDSVYHEHYTYFSLETLRILLAIQYLVGKEVVALIIFSWNYQDVILQKIRSFVVGYPTIIIPFPKLRVFVI